MIFITCINEGIKIPIHKNRMFLALVSAGVFTTTKRLIKNFRIKFFILFNRFVIFIISIDEGIKLLLYKKGIDKT